MSQLKGVIMAAGYGTRFFPITKSIPKEMLPLINKPSLDFIIDEFEQAGIKDIIIITHRKKKVLEDYLDYDPELDHFLLQNNKNGLQELIEPRKGIKFSFIRQQQMKGTGDALLLVKELVGDNHFILAYPDDIVLSEVSLSLQLSDLFKTHSNKQAILACEEISGDVSRFGVIKPGKTISEGLYEIQDIIEKPVKGLEPSKMISIGRYLLTPMIFDILESLKDKERTGEFFLTEAFEVLSSKNTCLSYLYDGRRLDVGEPHSYIQSLLFYIKSHPEYKHHLENIM